MLTLRCNGGLDVLLVEEDELDPDAFGPIASEIIIRSGAPYGACSDQKVLTTRWVARLFVCAPRGCLARLLHEAWRDEELRAACLSVVDLAGRADRDARLEAFLREVRPALFVDEDPTAVLGA